MEKFGSQDEIMSIESLDYNTNNLQSNDNSSSKAPPPPPPHFSAQRKRPPLSNLGIEVSLASDVKTPNTPTPHYSNDNLDSSEAVLKIRSSSSISEHNQHHPQPQLQQQQISYQNYPAFSKSESFKEPRLSQMIDLLADFESVYNSKSQRLDNLENQVNKYNELLRDKDNELKAFAKERVENLEQLRIYNVKMKELERKTGDLTKYDGFVKTKIGELESLMNLMNSSKESFKIKEFEFENDMEAKEKSLCETIKTIQELRLEKESLLVKIEVLNNENRDNCTEFNGRIYELNQEIGQKTQIIEKIESEKELLKSDLKNISVDRDRIQKECSNALKEVTELAISEAFKGNCESKDLGSLESSVLWIKELCVSLFNDLSDRNLDLMNLKQENEAIKSEISRNSKSKNELIDELKKLKEEFDDNEVLIDSLKQQLVATNQSKQVLEDLKIKARLKDDENWVETLKKSVGSTIEIEELKKKHEKELLDQKDEYGRLLREESSKWKLQKEELEAEISKLSKAEKTDFINESGSGKVQNNNGLKSKSQDLTAIIRDLKESSSLLGKSKPSNTRKRTSNSNIEINTTSSKRRSVASSLRNDTSSQRLSSPSSVNSNDIWNLFK